MNILDDYGCISFTKETVDQLNKCSAEELSDLIERIKATTTHTMHINIVDSLPDAEKFAAIAKVFLCEPPDCTLIKEFTIKYTKINFQLTQKLEGYLLEASIANTRLKRLKYSFAETVDISVENLLTIIGNCNYTCIQELDLMGCKLQDLNIDDLKLIIKACKDKKLPSVRWTWWDLSKEDHTWKDKFASATYADQQDLALGYLELLSSSSATSFYIGDLSQIPFDRNKYPQAFYDLLVAFFAINPNILLMKSILSQSKKDGLLSNQQAHEIILKTAVIKYGIEDANFTVLNLPTICHIIKETKDPYETGLLAELLVAEYEFTSTEEKKLFFEAIICKSGNIPSLFEISLEFEEIIYLSNELQTADPASSYLHSKHKDLTSEQKLHLLNLCKKFNHMLDVAGLGLSKDELLAYSKEFKNLSYFASGLLSAGLNKEDALSFIESALIEFNAADTQISLNALNLSKHEILEFIQRNPGWGHVLDEWILSQPGQWLQNQFLSQFPQEELKELLEIRILNSSYFVSEWNLSKYRIAEEDLPKVLIRLADRGCFVDVQLALNLNWADRYRLYRKTLQQEPASIVAMKNLAADGAHPALYEYLSCLPEDIEDCTAIYVTAEELAKYFSEIRKNLIDTFVKLTSSSEEAKSNLMLVDKKLFNMQFNMSNIIQYYYKLIWLIGLQGRLLAEVDYSQIQACLKQRAFITALEEIASFASPDFRAKSINFIITLLKDQQKFLAYCDIASGISLRCQIPALIIAANVQNPRKFVEIFKMIGSDYHDSKNLKILLNGFVSLFTADGLVDEHKFKIAHKVLSYDLKFQVVDNLSALRDLHAHHIAAGNLDFNRMYLTQIKDTSQFGILAFEVGGDLINLDDIAKDSRLIQLNSLLLAWVKNNKKISRLTNQIIATVASTRVFPCGLDSEQQALLMLQGLASINKLSAVIDDPSFKTKSWVSVYGTVLQTCFDIPEEKLEHVKAAVIGCRNPFSIIAYYAQLKTLDQHEPYTTMLSDYVRLISSSGARDFYSYRYNREHQPQLKAVLGNNKEALLAWRKGYSVNYNNFSSLVKDKFNLMGSRTIDPEKFITRQICYFKHLPEDIFPFIHQFLTAHSMAEKERIYVQANAKIKQYTSDSYSITEMKKNIELQITLMDYFNKENQLDARGKLQLLNKIKHIADGCKQATQFSNDMDNLTTILTQELEQKKNPTTTKVENTNGWEILDTDNFWDMFLIGTDVLGSCQNVNGTPRLNRCLIGGYVLSGHVRQIAIKNVEGEIVARAVFRLMRDKINKEPTLFLEEVYPHYCSDDYSKAIEAFAMLRALQLGFRLVSKTSIMSQQAYDNPLEVVAVKTSEYVDAIGTEQSSGYEVTGSFLVLDAPRARLDLKRELGASGMLMGRPSYGPRPLSSGQDLIFMYQNYRREVSQATPRKFMHEINLRLTNV